MPLLIFPLDSSNEGMSIRVRFAPSPTGPLHIGGVRTALYNYLLARKHGGTFILRIEDTDQTRYVPGAEDYIIEALRWVGIEPSEGPGYGGDYGPYRQSERKEIYLQYAERLVADGKAYYAFDSAEDLEQMRADMAEQGIHSAKYDAQTRMQMKNSFTLSAEEVEELKGSRNQVIRLNIPQGETISFVDEVRGKVSFSTDELDDKVILKGDGMPTYHLANIVDDHLMQITHVIRGEEWLPSTAHHVFMYTSMGWEPPQFAHLPLILNPNGKGKLSKRHGAKFGFPVFPLEWDAGEEGVFTGFREEGYLPAAVVNFLAFLGWNPGTDQEIFSIAGLADAFSVDKIVKSGARFDIDKARWYNQQYIIHSDDAVLAELIAAQAAEAGYTSDRAYLATVCKLMKERVETIDEIVPQGYYLLEAPRDYEEKMIRKKYKVENAPHFAAIRTIVAEIADYTSESLADQIKAYVNDQELGFGNVLPILRIASTGTMKGPDLFATLELLGRQETLIRMDKALAYFDTIATK